MTSLNDGLILSHNAMMALTSGGIVGAGNEIPLNRLRGPFTAIDGTGRPGGTQADQWRECYSQSEIKNIFGYIPQ